MATTTVTTLTRPRSRKGLMTILLVLGIVIAIGLFAWAEKQRRSAVKELSQTEQQLEEVKKSTQRSGEEVAKEVLSKVRNHMEVSESPAPTVATIVDVEKLKQTNEFYKKAKNGDHLIITQNRAILYAPDRDRIVDVVPVRVNPASPSPANAGAAPAPPTTSPSVASPANAGATPTP